MKFERPIFFVPVNHLANPVKQGASWWRRLFAKRTSDSPPKLVDKFGGLPFGLPMSMWPICTQCEFPMSLIAQIHHRPATLEIGDRMLFVFWCEPYQRDDNECAHWETDSGANAALLVPIADLDNEETAIPMPNVPVFDEYIVQSWRECTSENEHEDGCHLGGPPCWLQSSEQAPNDDFLLQIPESFSNEHFCNSDGSRASSPEGNWGPNVCGCGLAYIFGSDDGVGDGDEGAVLIQR